MSKIRQFQMRREDYNLMGLIHKILYKGQRSCYYLSRRLMSKQTIDYCAITSGAFNSIDWDEIRSRIDESHTPLIASKNRIKGKILSDVRKEIIRKAEDVYSGRFDVLSWNSVYLGMPPEWHIDFVSGICFPKSQFYRAIRRTRSNDNSDIKIPWELSRFHFVTVLGQAYWLTGDEKYTITFRELVDDWLANNLPERGVNWACTMEVAIRAVNWVMGYWFFSGSSAIDKDFWVVFIGALLKHAWFIRRNLEWSNGARSNHYLSNLMGLYYLGTLFGTLSIGRRWRGFAWKQLLLEVQDQVNDDGVTHENSIGYHRLVTEIILLCYLLAVKNEVLIPEDFKERLRLMLRFVAIYTKPNGKAPVIGDSDDGRVLILNPKEYEDRTKHNSILALGVGLIKNVPTCTGQDAIWVFGENCCVDNSGQLRHQKEYHSYPTGFHIIKWDDLYMCIRCGSLGRCRGHSHCDQLHFDLSIKTIDILVDAGTFCYTANPRLRNEFRSSRSHNGLVVDGKEHQGLDACMLFEMKDKAKARCSGFIDKEERVFFFGAHSGYAEYGVGQVKREFEIVNGNRVYIRDSVEVHKNRQKKHDLYLNLRFAPNVEVALSKSTVYIGSGNTLIGIIKLPESGRYKQEQGYVSQSYGRQEPTTVIQGRFSFDGEFYEIPWQIQVVSNDS